MICCTDNVSVVNLTHEQWAFTLLQGEKKMYYLNVRYQGSSWGGNGLLREDLDRLITLDVEGDAQCSMAGIQLYWGRSILKSNEHCGEKQMGGEGKGKMGAGQHGRWLKPWRNVDRDASQAEWPKDCFISRLNNTSSQAICIAVM